MKHHIGILGAGRIGRIHAANLQAFGDVEVSAVADPRIGEAREWAKGAGVARVEPDYRAVLDDPAITAVFICSSTDTHARIITEAAAAGKHIFCEKPVDLTFGAAKAAVDAAAQAGVSLQIGLNRRFDPGFARMREAVGSGEIGAVEIVRVTSRDPEPPPKEYVAVSGGIFLDMSIHDFDMARFLSGNEVEEVYATGSCLVDPAIGEAGDIDTAVVVLRFSGGAVGVIDNSRRAVYGYDQRAEVFGSAGAIHADNELPTRVTTTTHTGSRLDRPLWFFLERYAEAYRREARSFIDALAGNAPVPVTGQDGIAALVIALAATRSLREQRPVRIAEIEGER